jgi:hypothetical protein
MERSKQVHKFSIGQETKTGLMSKTSITNIRLESN